MCYRFKSIKKVLSAEKEFNAVFKNPDLVEPGKVLNGYDYPTAAVIMDAKPDIIQTAQWGLIPFWAKDSDIQKNTLNARIETIEEKNSFKNSVNNRCLILASEFYEWKWDTPGDKKSKKQLHAITVPGRENFAMAGLYNIWNGTPTFTILTTEANKLMAEVHNNKKRMPVVLHKDEEKLWLNRDKLMPYHNRTEIELHAQAI